MDTRQFGKTISHFRQVAGYTQRALADALGITDKAVSKWERGLACPDISLLPRLAGLLDVDLPMLFSDLITYQGHDWCGVLVIEDEDIGLDTLVYDKPLVYYLLSNFLLVGIRNVLIVASDHDCAAVEARVGSGERFGITVHYAGRERSNVSLGRVLERYAYLMDGKNVFVLNGRCFLYGMNLTRQFQTVMSQCTGAVRLCFMTGAPMPFLFCGKEAWKAVFRQLAEIKDSRELLNAFSRAEMLTAKEVGRGMIFLPLDSADDVVDVSHIVKVLQRSTGEGVSDLGEIACRRGLIPATESYTGEKGFGEEASKPSESIQGK